MRETVTGSLPYILHPTDECYIRSTLFFVSGARLVPVVGCSKRLTSDNHPVAFSSMTTTALIDAGADVNAKTHEGSSVLHYGVRSRNSAVVSALVSRGAGASNRDGDGLTAVDRASTYRSSSLKNILLYRQTPGNIAPQFGGESIRGFLGAAA